MGYIQLGATYLTKIRFTAKQFKNKSRCICKHAIDVVVVKLFIKFKVFTTRESNDCQTFFEWMNSIGFKASLCQTLDVSNSKRMNQCFRYVRRLIFDAREGNDRQTCQ